MSVKISKSGDTLTIHVDHPLAAKIDHTLVAGCLEAVLECCASSGCCDGQVALNERCLATVAKHNEASGCITSCFGCA